MDSTQRSFADCLGFTSVCAVIVMACCFFLMGCVTRQPNRSATHLVLNLDGRTNCVPLYTERLSSLQLPAGTFSLSLGGPGVKQGGSPDSVTVHYAFVVCIGRSQNAFDAVGGLYGEGDEMSINLPEGGTLCAFLQDSYAGDNLGHVDLKITTTKREEKWSLIVDNRAHVVIVDPWRVKSPELPPGEYYVSLDGSGVLYGPRSQNKRSRHVFIVAYGPRTEIAYLLKGKASSRRVSLPYGGIISAFLCDLDPEDNSGNVVVSITRLNSREESWTRHPAVNGISSSVVRSQNSSEKNDRAIR